MSTEQDEYDYGNDAAPARPALAKAFEDLDALVQEHKKIGKEIGELEGRLKAKQDRQRDIAERFIPEQMEGMRQRDLVAHCGARVQVKQVIRASALGRDNPKREQGLQWLIDSGNGGIVTSAVVVEMARGDAKGAETIAAELAGRGLDANAKRDVNHQTLSKLFRELFEKGKAVPRDLFNVFDQKVATVTWPDEDKDAAKEATK